MNNASYRLIMGNDGETAILCILRSKLKETAGNYRSNFSEACNLWTAVTGPWRRAPVWRNEEKFVERYREVRCGRGIDYVVCIEIGSRRIPFSWRDHHNNVLVIHESSCFSNLDMRQGLGGNPDSQP